jgi:periplasmic divalent cation tolerance protein
VILGTMWFPNYFDRRGCGRIWSIPTTGSDVRVSCLRPVGGKTDFPTKRQKVKKETLLTPVWEIASTVSQHSDAEMLASQLVAMRLAACVQIQGPIQSFYQWEGKTQNESEWKLTIKTHELILDRCLAKIEELHPYKVPEIIAKPIERVSSKYLDWLVEQTTLPAFHIRIQFDTNPPTFDEAYDRLSRRPNVFVELDGSFVWRASIGSLHDPSAPQLDGMLYDRDERMEYVEVKGACDRLTWSDFLATLVGECGSTLRFQDVSNGQWMSLEAFAERW